MAFLQYNGDWRNLAQGKRVKLYKWQGGEWVHFDYGFENFIDKYMDRGLMVEFINGKRETKSNEN